jgi:hypothetical protein
MSHKTSVELHQSEQSFVLWDQFYDRFFSKTNLCHTALTTQAGDRCYDYLNIFAEKIGQKIGVFD